MTRQQEPPNKKKRGAQAPNPLLLRLATMILLSSLQLRMAFDNARWDADFFFDDPSSFSEQILQENGKIQLQLTPSCEDESSNCNIPQWMKDYFRWHQQTLRNITQPSDWLQHRILVLKCAHSDACGGTADRLRPLPYYLAVAARAKRLFFIRWTKPLPLEEILEPYQLNWAMPRTLAHFFGWGNGTISEERNLILMAEISLQSEPWALQVLSQSMKYAEEYRKVAGDLEEDVSFIVHPFVYFHDLFLALFRPVPALRDTIETAMNSLHLVPNQFVVAHIRALYPSHPYERSGNVTDLEPYVWNAVDCASYAFPGAPLFVTSDTSVSKQVAVEYDRHRQGQNQENTETNSYNDLVVASDLDLVSNSTNSSKMGDPLHLDETRVGEHHSSEYFSIFSDLLIMSQSRCVAYGGGGFGLFGSHASFNSTCGVQHSTIWKGIMKCDPPASARKLAKDK